MTLQIQTAHWSIFKAAINGKLDFLNGKTGDGGETFARRLKSAASHDTAGEYSDRRCRVWLTTDSLRLFSDNAGPHSCDRCDKIRMRTERTAAENVTKQYRDKTKYEIVATKLVLCGFNSRIF